QIAVDHALLMCRLQRIGGLLGDLDRLLQWHWTLRDTLSQRHAFDQLHDQGALLHPINRCDIRMVQRGEHLRLALEARHAIGILRERWWEDFDGYVAIELGVRSAPDLSHAAGAKLGGYPVMGDD